MAFLVLAFDFRPPEGPERRKTVREDHLKQGERLYQEGKWLYAAGILNEAGEIVGSMIICDYPTEEALRHEWLNQEPYLLNRVWEKVQIFPLRLAPFLAK